MNENTSVVEALKAAGLYKEEGRTEKQVLKVVSAGGTKEYTLSSMDYLDLKVFADELDIALKIQNPRVQGLFVKNALLLCYLVRAVNVETLSGFKGSMAAGRQLDAILLRAEQFQDPGAGAGVMRTTWERNIPAAASVVFIQSTADTGAELVMGADEGMCILGFYNPASSPVCNALQISKIGELQNIQNCYFEAANPFVGDAIVELKQPLFWFPRESASITVRYFEAGDDELTPIGLYVKMASNLRDLTAS